MKLIINIKKLKLGVLLISLLWLTGCVKERVKTKIITKPTCYHFTKLTDNELEAVAIFIEQKEHTTPKQKGMIKIVTDWITLTKMIECKD